MTLPIVSTYYSGQSVALRTLCKMCCNSTNSFNTQTEKVGEEGEGRVGEEGGRVIFGKILHKDIYLHGRTISE